MNQYAQRIARDYPVRRKAQEKENMRAYLIGQLRALGYDARLDDCDRAVNVIAGDPERARIFYAAHYDTGLHELLPPVICPTRPVTYVLYQALTPLAVLLVSFAVSLGVTFALNWPNLTLPLFMVLLLGALAYLRYGPAEQSNLNDNTSGVAVLLETAEKLTPRYRNDVCFLFLDGGSGNMQGAKGFRGKYPRAKEKPVICLDCVGSGDELLILPGKGARWDGDLLDAVNASFENTARKTCYDKVDGLVHYPSDNRAFKQGVAICAVRHVRGFGRIIRPTGKDNAIDDENLNLLRDGLVRLAAAYQIKK